MKHDRIMNLLARARLDIDEAAVLITRGLEDSDPGRINQEMLEVRARVEALEARVAVLEARGEC